MTGTSKTMIVVILFFFKKMNYLRINKQSTLNRLPFTIGILSLFLLIFFFRFDILFAVQKWRYRQLPFQEKIWVHRVNSLERLANVQGDYSGLEADIFFDSVSQRFIVNHPPSTVKDLSLQEWIMHVDASKKIWLDVKLLDSINVANALHSLNTISFDKSVFIFECYQLVEAESFLKYGYQVALNIDASIINGDDSIKKQFITSIPENLQYVSQEDLFVDSLKKMFPDKKIITWSTSFYHIFNLNTIRTLLQENNVEVVLVNVKSKGYL